MADMTAASTLRKASCPPLHYIPRTEAHMIALARFAMHSCCPYEGEASCFSILLAAVGSSTQSGPSKHSMTGCPILTDIRHSTRTASMRSRNASLDPDKEADRDFPIANMLSQHLG